METSALKIQKPFNLLSPQIRRTLALSKFESSGRMDPDRLHRSRLSNSITKRIYSVFINKIRCSHHACLTPGNTPRQELTDPL